MAVAFAVYKVSLDIMLHIEFLKLSNLAKMNDHLISFRR